MIFQILEESGKKVWVYTSPHNIDIRERFETDIWLISEEKFISYVLRILDYSEQLSWYFSISVIVDVNILLSKSVYEDNLIVPIL